MRIKVNINIKVNRLVKRFLLVDLALFAGWGFIEPVFAVFVIQRVAGADIAAVGIAAGLYLVLKSLLQLPIANYLDQHPGEEDDFRFLLAGLLLASLTAFLFVLVDKIWELYLLQVLHAVALALYTPSWSGIFSRHLDKDRISFDWSLDSTTIGLAAGLTGVLGGIIAQNFGFAAVFILAAIFSMVSALILFTAPTLIFPKPTESESIPLRDHAPLNIDK